MNNETVNFSETKSGFYAGEAGEGERGYELPGEGFDEGPMTNADSISFELLCDRFEKMRDEPKVEKKLALFFSKKLREKIAVGCNVYFFPYHLTLCKRANHRIQLYGFCYPS